MRSYFLQFMLAVILAAGSFQLMAAEEAQQPSAQPLAEQAVANRIDLNSADAATLKRELSGVGSVKANAIVSHRDTHGAFVSVDELLEVQGIGKSIFEQNRDKLSVD